MPIRECVDCNADLKPEDGEQCADCVQHEAYFERFTIQLTRADAESVSGPGSQDENVKALSRCVYVMLQLVALDPAAVAAELGEYGAWDGEELTDHDQNLQRILWIAGCNIREELAQADR